MSSRLAALLGRPIDLIPALAVGLLGGVPARPHAADPRLFSQEQPGAELREIIKKDLEFDSLPGKAGLLKAGLRFNAADHAELTGFVVGSDSHRIYPTRVGTAVVRIVRLHRAGAGNADAPDGVTVEIQVDPISTDNAQEGVVAMLLNSSYQAPGGPLLERGDRKGLRVGDFNFLPPIQGPRHRTPMITFVRNNVRVLLLQTGSPDVDLTKIADGLDELLQQSPSMDGTQLRAAHIPTARLIPAKSSVGRGERINVTLEASDPQSLPIRRVLKASGGVLTSNPADPSKLVFTATEGTGTEGVTAHLSVTVINDAGLFHEARATLFVSPNRP